MQTSELILWNLTSHINTLINLTSRINTLISAWSFPKLPLTSVMFGMETIPSHYAYWKNLQFSALLINFKDIEEN